MKPEEFAQRLQTLERPRVQSVILYGSAAAGDHAGRRSDYNLLVVADRLGVEDLERIAPLAAAWTREGNPPPLLFTAERLRRAADVFPIELLDMKDCRRVVAGDDVLADLEVSRENLRLELEHELRGKLIALREQFLLASGRPARIERLLVESLSPFLVLCRAALRLFGPGAPAVKMEALKELAARLSFDTAAFEQVRALKEGRARLRGAEARALFGRYLEAVEIIVDAVDAHLRGGGPDGGAAP